MKNKFLPLFFLILTFINLSFAQNDESWKLYDDTQVARIDITVNPADVIWMYENVESDSFHFASVKFKNAYIDETIDSVGFRLRGNTSRDAQKKSFKLSFDHFVGGREFYGVDALNLNGEHNDPSISRSKICWDFFKDIGMISSRASHAVVYIDGKYFGVYISVEHIDKEFLKKNYTNAGGNLWKCLYPADLTYKGSNPNSYKFVSGNRRTYELKTNELDDDYTQLARFINIINNTPSQNILDSLQKILNVNEFLKYLAVDILTSSWDDYWSLQNNYYIYYNPDEDRFRWIPYDYDNTLGIDFFGTDWWSADPYNFPKVVNGARPLAEKVINNSQLRNLYTHFINFYSQNVFNLSKLETRIDNLKSLIFPYISADTFRTKDYDFDINDFNNSFTTSSYYHEPAKKGIKQYINERLASITSMLNYQNAKPNIYELEYYPKNPSPTDSIHFVVSAFSNLGLSEVGINFQEQGSSSSNKKLMTYNPIIQTKKVEEADRWIGTIPPIGAGKKMEVWVSAKDNNSQSSDFPHNQKINIQTSTSITSGILINEFLAKNDSLNADPNAQFEDWIELYNTTGDTLSLSGLYLTDKPDRLTKWQFPDSVKIMPHGFILLWCDEDQNQLGLHTNFKLSNSGEFIALTAADTTIVLDSLSFGVQSSNISFGRYPDGSDSWSFLNPTPASSNLITSVKEKNNLPEKFSIQNYPNPFNPTTKIRYVIPASLKPSKGGTLIQLKIYDVLGNKVATLINEEKIPGEYEAEFNANVGADSNSPLPSGVYFYRLQAGEFFQTKKMVLLK